MAKGDDAVRRKKNKVNRKRMRGDESSASVSARVASIISSKRRRKAGKRRACEGMCFSLPTPDDPFNERNVNKAPSRKKPKKLDRRRSPPFTQKGAKREKEKKDVMCLAKGEQPVMRPKTPSKFGGKAGGGDGSSEDGCPSKFLILCLNAIQDAWAEKGASDDNVDTPLLVNKWGVQFWKCCSAGSNIVDTSGACASREQIAWLVSTASDVVARKEKQGCIIPSPFLLVLVPSQEKAVQVRSVCRPLKALGVHTVSLHPGASLDHQVRGLKSCEPEFLVSTPERLLELVLLRAIDISGISLLVLDGLNQFVDLGLVDTVKSIRENISGDPQIIVFSDCYGEVSISATQSLLRGPINRLSLYDSVTSQSALISQYIHFYTSEEEKISKVLQILRQVFGNRTPSQRLRVLFIAGTTSNAQTLTSFLKAEGYAISNDSSSDGLQGAHVEETPVSVMDIDSVRGRADVEEIEIVIFVDFPSLIDDYVVVLTQIARYSVDGILHAFFSEADASLAVPLIKVLEQCGQTVPESLKRFDT